MYFDTVLCYIVFIAIYSTSTDAQILSANQTRGAQSGCEEEGKFQCENGECIEGSGLCDNVVDCTDGSDEAELTCLRHHAMKEKTCEPLISKGVKIKCLYDQKPVSCVKNIRPGTMAVMDCILKIKPLGTDTVYHNYCLQNGTWLYPIPDCSLIDCRVNSEQLEGGMSTDRIHPWNAMIYYQGDNGIRLLAMGVLVTELCVLTNIHLISSDTDDIPYNPNLRVVLGQEYQSFLDPRNRDMQIYKTGAIVRNDLEGTRHSSITLILLRKPAQLNYKVKPACIDTTQEILTNKTLLGTMVARNLTENNTDLVEISLLYQDDCNIETARGNFSQDPRELFCVYKNGTTSNTKIDLRGAGFMINFDGMRFLYGLFESVLQDIRSTGSVNESYVFSRIMDKSVIDYLKIITKKTKNSYEKSCVPILSTYSMTVDCFYEGKMIPCSGRMKIGSMVRSRCNIWYRSSEDPLSFNNYCLNNGTWLYQNPGCTHECGSGVPTLPDNDMTSITSPWHASVYHWVTEPERKAYKCNAVLVTPFSVLTELACITNDSQGLVSKTLLKVAVGKTQIHYDSFLDNEAQQFDVDDVYGVADYGLVILELSDSVIISEFTMPVCIDYDRKYFPKEGSIGNVVYWGYRDDNQDVITLINHTVPYLNEHDCKNMFEKQSKYNSTWPQGFYCGFYDNETYIADNVPEYVFERGSAMTFQFDGRHYLFGVEVERYLLSVSNQADSNGNTNPVFKLMHILKNTTDGPTTKFLNYLSIHISVKHSIPINKCIVPTANGTKYSYSPCNSFEHCEEILPLEYIDQFTKVYINCKRGYALADEGFWFTTCNRGKWQPDQNTCVRLCNTITSKSTWTQCTYKKKVQSCDDKIRPGTMMISDCSAGYISMKKGFYNNQCLPNGEWERPQQQCSHICGAVNTSIPLIQNGTIAIKTQHPWNAAVYLVTETGPQHICGGTLISPMSVLTAAHCVYNQTHKIKILANRFMVGLGKLNRRFEHPDDIHAEYRKVKMIYIPNIFDGGSINFLFDIAIFELDSPTPLNTFILPACLDMSNEIKLNDSSVGTVVGWGLDNISKYGVPNELLHKAELPYLSHEECLATLTSSDKGALTKDKFCAFFFDGETTTSVRSGDSGSGLVFEFNKRNYVLGLVSTQIKEIVSTFTDLRYPQHMNFITDTLQTITRKFYNSTAVQ